MKRPFAVKLRRYELLGGLLWLCVYAFALGPMISPALRALGLPGDSLTRNKIYYLAGFGITAALLWRFLRDSLQAAYTLRLSSCPPGYNRLRKEAIRTRSLCSHSAGCPEAVLCK